MDNNNLNQPMTDGSTAQPSPQPMPGQQPMGQPMPGQGYYGQPMQQPMNNTGYGPQPNPIIGQPYSPYPQQPMMQPPKPPKQPIDPAKKKKIIVGVSIGVALLVLGIAAAIIAPILLRVDYGPAYATVKDLKPKIYNIYRNYDCGYVIDYATSTYTTPKKYSEYVSNCEDTYDQNVNELIAKLGNTDGVKRNNEINAQFSKFKAEYDTLAPDGDSLDAKLSIWQAVHDFVYASNDLSYSKSSNAEFTAAANNIINTGNETLKTYGEAWLERSLDIAAAYRAYDAASWPASTSLYNEYTNKRNEFKDWMAANKPNLQDIAPLNFDNTSKMYNEFSTLYDLITETYEENYNYDSGDCTEFLGEVYCE